MYYKFKSVRNIYFEISYFTKNKFLLILTIWVHVFVYMCTFVFGLSDTFHQQGDFCLTQL